MIYSRKRKRQATSLFIITSSWDFDTANGSMITFLCCFFFGLRLWRNSYPAKEGRFSELWSNLGEVWKWFWRYSRWVRVFSAQLLLTSNAGKWIFSNQTGSLWKHNAFTLYLPCITSLNCLLNPVSSELWVTSLSLSLLHPGEFWLGLRKIHSLSSQGNSVLHIQLEDWKQDQRFIEYRFHLSGPDSNYAIHLTHLSGNLPDPMSNHTGMMFSTKDRDNDNNQDSNCAQQQAGAADVASMFCSHVMLISRTNECFSSSVSTTTCNFCHLLGGWWFNACGDTNLNGRYFHMRPKGRTVRRRGIQRKSGRKAAYSFIQISVHTEASPTSDSPESGVLLWSSTSVPQ